MPATDLSVIILNYNTKNLLRDCLHSIYTTKTQVPYEVVVVDNHSSDGSPQMVRTEFPQVILQVNTENLGFSRANNQGIKLSRGRYVLLLNSDTLVMSGCFDHLVSFAGEHPNAGVVGGAHLAPGSLRRTPSFSASLLFRARSSSRRQHLLSSGWVSGACMLLRRQAGEMVGWLDEDFVFGSEDVDICWRMIKAGWKVYYDPEAQVIHYGGKSGGKNFNPWVYYHSERGNVLLLQKHATWPHKFFWSAKTILDILPSLAVATLAGENVKASTYRKVLKMALSLQP